MPIKQRVVGLNPTQGSSFFLEKRVVLGDVELFAFALRITLDAHAYRVSDRPSNESIFERP